MKSKDTLLQRILPSPFSLAVLLTFLTFFLAVAFTESSVTDTLVFWQTGFSGLLKFAMQMMLMLVLGSVIALTRPFTALIYKILPLAKNNATAALWISLMTILVAYLNWGLGLIFGALLAKKMSEYAAGKGFELNYPLMGAAAYSGLMIWHGGLSGSAPLKVAEQGHFLEDKIGVIPVTETIFSSANIVLFFLVIVVIPLTFYLMGKKYNGVKINGSAREKVSEPKSYDEKKTLDTSRSFSLIIALFMLVSVIVVFYKKSFSLDINTINLILFGIAVLLYPNLKEFTTAAAKSISSTTGIMLQFPLYAGIMGMMNYSGLTDIFTRFFIDISNEYSFPVFTMISAGIVNFFVPSGGGQWAVQGPVITEAALNLGVPVSKAVMALAYGDQLTNMMQPFWALPLLAVTGLKAKDILPYSLKIMAVGFVLFTIVLLI